MSSDTTLRVRSRRDDDRLFAWTHTRFFHKLPLQKASSPGKVIAGLSVELSDALWELDIDPLQFRARKRATLAFPGDLPDDWKQLDHSRGRYTGFVKIEKSGRIRLELPKGATGRVRINGTVVLEDHENASQAVRRADIALEQGFHPVEIVWLRASNTDDFDILWSNDGSSPEPVARDIWFHSPVAANP